ncbi:MAG: penicillin-binding transpeptidase domain-containing protein [Gemmatimonas sp.]
MTMARSPDASRRAESNGAPVQVSRGRAAVVHASLVLFALAIVGRAAQLQLVEGERWVQVARVQQVRESDVMPPRGRILDATGTVLVETREMMRLNISPRDLKKSKEHADPRRTLRSGLEALNVSDSLVRRALDTTRKAVLLPGKYLPSDVERLRGVPGVFRESVLQRSISAPVGIQRVLGEVNSEDVPKGGIEQELDPVLRGIDGRDALFRDGRGRLTETPQLARTAARAGHTVTLTLNRSLQEIAERELGAVLRETGASGGDVVMINPRDGSVLALAGYRNGRPAITVTALTEPYEAGSVMKPFLVARLLDERRARPDEMINTENGAWAFAKRTIRDEHKAPSMAVRDVIRFSSNIGVVKLAQRFTPQEQYEALRDFGFGVPTGVPYPAESRGVLYTPAKWLPQDRESMAMGYRVSATPLQIAVAYAALANGGELLQPALVKEIRDADGVRVFRHQRRVLRRVLSSEGAATMKTMLESVVDSGTAMAARLSTYDVAGKSGTARRVVGKGYGSGKYNSTFAGMFPAQLPQYVFVARLIDPQGKIYGGTVAGNLINRILQAALATRDASLDLSALASVEKALPAPPRKPLTPAQLEVSVKDSLRRDSLRAPVPTPVQERPVAARVVVTLPVTSTPARRERASRAGDSAAGSAESRLVPTVYGLTLRQAVRTLHAAGFQVRIAKGADGTTRPASGATARSGTTVVLESRQ